MTRESFLQGAVILAAASLISRLIGLVYMVVLPRLIYDDGMGLYQLVKPIHYFAAVLAIAGLPVAISKLTAEQAALGSPGGVRRVFQTGAVLMLVTGGVVGAGLLFGAPWLAVAFAQGLPIQNTLAILGPACFFLALSAALRGFFQGMQEMTPAAVSQVADQIVRIVATIFFVLWLRPYGLEQAVAGIAWGFLCGEACGLATLSGFYVFRSPTLFKGIKGSKSAPRQIPLLGKMVSLAFPAVLATVLWPVMQLADSLLIPARMQAAGFSAQAIREGLGHLGMALTLVQFPNIITVALATTLVPAIAEAAALGSKRLISHRVEEGLRLTLILGIPFLAAFLVLSAPLGEVVFAYAKVGPPLRLLATGTVALGLIQATTSILQGLGAMAIPVRNLLVGVGLKFTLNYLLIARPTLGISGAALSTTASWAAVAVLNLGAVLKRARPALNWRPNLLYPSMAGCCAAVSMYYLYDTARLYFPEVAAVLGALLPGFLLYFLLLLLSGSLCARDVRLLPVFGRRLGAFLQSWGFLRS